MTTVQETHDWCTHHGFFPVVLHPRSKASVSRNYVEPNYQAPPAGAFFPDKNIGVVLGPARKGPVDIDIDCPEAAFFAPYFLPKTNAIFGRKSKPRSHYLYIIKESYPTIQITDKSVNGDKKTIIEMRADAATAVQTVLPGSIHECGEPVEWVSESHDPAVVTAEELSRAVKRVAAAVVVARHFWGSGCRHSALMPMAGMAHRAGWSLDETISFIRAVMEYAGDDEKSRIPTVRTTFSKAEAGGKVTGATSLKEIFGDERGVNQLQSLMRGVDDDLGDALAAFDEKWAVVHYAGKTRITNLDATPGSYRTYFDIDDFHAWTGDQHVTIMDSKGKAKSIPLSKAWLPRASRNRIEFVPGAEECDVVNEWTGWAVRPAKGEFLAFDELLRGLTKKTNTYDAVMTFLANVFREPRHKTKTILVFIGKQSAGKTLLFSYINKMLGKFMVVASHPDQITGKFNDHLALSLLLVSEEAVYAGNHNHMNTLKAISGRDAMNRETKGGSVRVGVPDYNRIVILSNDHHAAPIEAGDTRYIVVDTGDFLCSRELRDRLIKEREGTGPSALLHHFLEEYDYDVHKLAEAKLRMKTSKAVASMKRTTGSSVSSWWEDTLIEGQLLPLNYWSVQKPNDVRWPTVVARSGLHNAYSAYCEQHRLKTAPNGAFWSELERMLGQPLGYKPCGFPTSNSMVEVADWIKDVAMQGKGATQRRILKGIDDFPSLEACRKAYDAYIDREYAWPEVEDDLPSAPEPMEY
jgi:hypothetical protein